MTQKLQVMELNLLSGANYSKGYFKTFLGCGTITFRGPSPNQFKNMQNCYFKYNITVK